MKEINKISKTNELLVRANKQNEFKLKFFY